MIWYLRTPEFLTRVLPGGRLLVLSEGANSANDMKRLQIVREMDLAGNIIRETNISRVAEQLESRGIHSDCKKDARECVSGIHHEAIRLPNGSGDPACAPLSAGTQDAEPVISGRYSNYLDEDFQVAAVWNSFDHVDLKRKALADAAKCRVRAWRGARRYSSRGQWLAA